ncbi:hypothetical protein CEXT_145181 [Caerostris extrusa]|uniref:Uncharacterized protein n=1 Tax=Caerostris extrusa TaxID=172846 RepID=A0AAV4PWQ7_CAEEX|nr:hypothetical protein CEXT_145181 [Caerostris extrusa]
MDIIHEKSKYVRSEDSTLGDSSRHMFKRGIMMFDTDNKFPVREKGTDKNGIIDFVSVNEPYIFENTITAIPINYKIVAADCGPRAALVIRSTLETQAILVTRIIVHLIIHDLDCLLISTY